ncbi:radical SAM protein [Thermotoga sp. KOL6]|uniref:radical SAM protein n=1 Tax=Thermotoga sp. KOL6 TaxID=126741 RepID=UPI000C776495|nr:radical SAM protein [Thermotoga sp. KOL6]PLV58998.1 radical SAM protein [Thermotoga sp. KOL6]
MVLRASVGTLQKIVGKLPFEMDTAYLMLGERCVYNCLYCAQARSSKAPPDRLSRVVWKEISDLEEINYHFKRVCIQVVSQPGYKEVLLSLIPKFRIPVSVSVRPISVKEVIEYFELGIDRIGIAIDVPNRVLFRKLRGGDYDRLLSILEKSSTLFPRRVTTHVIVGLGESDRDIVEFALWTREKEITLSLFAFTPLKGTALERKEKPSLERYRKIQLATFLLEKNVISLENIIFGQNDEIVDIEWSGVAPEEAFKTRGCPHCTRPYYNESPKGPIYNLHWR